MKHMKFLRLLGVTLVLSLLFATLPTLPALALSFSLDKSSGKIGDNVTADGNGFSASTETTEKWASIYFSSNDAAIGQYIDTQVKTYTLTASGLIGYLNDDDEGEFSATFRVPSVLDDGDVNGTVAPGTYYIYATVTTAPTLIKAKTTFTVVANTTLNPLSVTSGAAGTDVTVSGTNFLVSYPIIFKFDTTTITPKSGDSNTNTSGGFSSVITIPPDAAAGSHTIYVTVGTVVQNAAFTATASPTISPLSLTSGAAGTDVTISGSNFLVSYPVIFKFDTTTITPKAGTDANTSTSGSFASIITIPQAAAPGAHIIYVTVGTVTLNTPFTVTGTTTPTPTATPTATATPTPTATTPAATGTLKVSPATGSIGTTVNVIGTGFKANAKVTVKYNEKDIATATADATGVFITDPFKIPASTHGSNNITASDGTILGRQTFTVEAVALTAPKPLAPGAGAKSPAEFEWSAVAVTSPPVTYTLQISTAPGFTAGSIVLDKKGLTEPKYTLTKTDISTLDAAGETLYWRIQATDAASNASPWVVAASFSYTAPVSFTQTIYFFIILGIGGLLLLLLGFFIGRRTAYSY